MQCKHKNADGQVVAIGWNDDGTPKITPVVWCPDCGGRWSGGCNGTEYAAPGTPAEVLGLDDKTMEKVRKAWPHDAITVEFLDGLGLQGLYAGRNMGAVSVREILKAIHIYTLAKLEEV